MAHILIADDEPDVRAFVRRGLMLDGHTIEAVEDGGAALQAIRLSNPPFDLVLSDIKMPIMDGIQLALAIAQDWPDLPILLMTGFADQRERAHGLDDLIIDVLQKPFTLDVLRGTVARALAGSAGQ